MDRIEMVTVVNQQGVEVGYALAAVEPDLGDVTHVAFQQIVQDAGVVGRQHFVVRRTERRERPLADVEPRPRQVGVARRKAQKPTEVREKP